MTGKAKAYGKLAGEREEDTASAKRHGKRAGPDGLRERRIRAAERLGDERSLAWKDWTRFSSRQQREMTLGGGVGKWKLAGDLGELLPWFWLGQWLHVGKNATMGMGMYSLAW